METKEHLDHRDRSMSAAHGAIGWALRHLDEAAVHAAAVDDTVHLDMLSDIIRQLSVAREPLAEHIDWLQRLKSTGKT